MKDKMPNIYKNKINNLKTNIQKEYYYHFDEKNDNNDKNIENKDLLSKINDIFKNPSFIYKTDINIMYKNGDNIKKTIIMFKDDYLLTLDGEKIYISDIADIK